LELHLLREEAFICFNRRLLFFFDLLSEVGASKTLISNFFNVFNRQKRENQTWHESH
jgi:hypothetical protein